jgi:addiction module HigA family antidote
MVPSRRHPTHPGEVLQEEFLKPLNLSPKQFAQKLGTPWTEQEITAIINGEHGISEAAARDFAAALGTPVTFWNRLEQQYYQYDQVHRQNEKGSLKPWKKTQ